MPFDKYHTIADRDQLRFDFDKEPQDGRTVRSRKSLRHQTNYFSGLCAEESVRRFYSDRGARFLEARWRGPVGEIDLIMVDS